MLVLPLAICLSPKKESSVYSSFSFFFYTGTYLITQREPVYHQTSELKDIVQIDFALWAETNS